MSKYCLVLKIGIFKIYSEGVMIHKKLDEISLTFPELFIIKKYLKTRFKNRRPLCYILEVKRSKILQQLNQRDYCCNILGFIFYVDSCAKTDLHSKYLFNFVFGSFFEQDHLLNLFILRVYAKRSPKWAHISKQKLRTIHRGKKYGVRSKIMKKRKLCICIT